MTLFEFLKLILNTLVISPILEIIYRLQFLKYKRTYYKFFKKGFIYNDLNIVGYDKKDNKIWLKNLNDNETQEKIEDYALSNEEFKENYSNCLQLMVLINEILVPALRKYFLKCVKLNHKDNKYIISFISDLNKKGCTFKYNKLVDKIIVSKIKRMKIVKDKEFNENIKLSIMNMLIDFSRVEIKDIPGYVNISYNSIIKDNDFWLIFDAMIAQQLNVGCYIVSKLIKRMNNEEKVLAKRLSKRTLSKLQNKNPGANLYELPDYIILDELLDILN